MPRIFISHSSHDNAKALAVGQWLTDKGWTDFFLDIDADRGIAAGERWLKAFMNAVAHCEAVLFLLSPAWCRSGYCTAELAQAKVLGKRVFGLIIEAVEQSELPVAMAADWQICNLTNGIDLVEFRVARPPIVPTTLVEFGRAALSDLERGLRKAGLEARSFAWPPPEDPRREPYRGLDPLQELDAGIFFGRDAAIVQALDRIRLIRSRGTEKSLVILGASGAGKSSFLRAGLVPRLRRQTEHFVVLRPVRPEGAAINGPQGLLASLRAAERDDLHRSTIAEVKQHLAEKGLAKLLTDRRITPDANGAQTPTIVLPIDQAEDLSGPVGRAESEELLSHLKSLHDDADSVTAMIVVYTARSDAWPLPETPWMQDGSSVLFYLPPIPQSEFKLIIEGPAQLHSKAQRPVTIHPELSQRLVAESVGPDALPLLALTLQWLYRHFERDGGAELGVKEYETLGSIGAVIDAAVKRAFESPGSEPRIPEDPTLRLHLLRSTFALLATVDADTGEARRRVATRSELRSCGLEAYALVQRLLKQRLLRSDGHPGGEQAAEIVEVAHEALLRQWSLLTDWLLEHTLQLQRIERLESAAKAWAKKDGDRADRLIHRGEELALAEALAAESLLARRLTDRAREYLRACRDEVERQREEREAQESLVAISQAKTAKWQKRVGWVLGISLVGLSILLVATWLQTQQLHEAEVRAESLELARRSAADPNLQAKLELAIRAVELGPNQEAATIALVDAVEDSLAAFKIEDVKAYAVDPQGRYIAVAAARGHSAMMDLQSGRTTTLCGKPESISELSFSPDGRYLLVGRERLFKDARGRAYQPRYETQYDLWNTHDGRVQGTVAALGRSARAQWAPNSSAFVSAAAFEGEPVLVRIGPEGATPPVSLKGTGGFVFSADKPLFLSGIGTSPSRVSLWGLSGEFLGATEAVVVNWTAFEKGGAAVAMGHLSNLSRYPLNLRALQYQVDVVGIDAQGRLARTRKVVDADIYDWSRLKGAPLGTKIDAPFVRAAGDQTKRKLECRSATADLRVGIGICVREGAPPVLFDAGTLQELAPLLPWNFDTARLDFLFSQDGKIVVLTNDLGSVAAWDVTTREPAKLNLPPGSPNRVEWIDSTGSVAILYNRGDRGGTRLTQWDVGKEHALRTLEIDMKERQEFEQDSNKMRASPTPDEVLKIARRRLRRCN